MTRSKKVIQKLYHIGICISYGPGQLFKMDARPHQGYEAFAWSHKEQFEQQCHWVISKTNRRFSTISIDQAHEQENAHVKGTGGCIGLTKNPVTFR